MLEKPWRTIGSVKFRGLMGDQREYAVTTNDDEVVISSKTGQWLDGTVWLPPGAALEMAALLNRAAHSPAAVVSTPPEPSIEPVPTDQLLKVEMPTIVRSIALTQSIMRTAISAGETAIANVCDEWTSLMFSLMAANGLREEYERTARNYAADQGGV